MQRNASRLRGHSHHLGSLKIGFAKALGAALLIISGLFWSLAANALSTTIVISQVYGGGGNTGSVYKNDFVELYNLSAAPVNVNGWSVQYASATGVFSSPITLTGTIPAGGYYLVQLAVGTGGTTNLPAPDATGTVAMSAEIARTAANT